MTFPDKPYKPQQLDYELLAKLPVEGANLGPHTLARPVNSLVRAFGLSPMKITARLREMHAEGLVVTVESVVASDPTGWQKTKKGTAALERHQKGEGS